MEDTWAPDPLSDILRPWEDDARKCFPESLTIRWDQWAVCTMTCKHGSWRAVSRGQSDMLESVRNAQVNFDMGHIGIDP